MNTPGVLVTGASGLVGRALAGTLPTVPLPRRDPGGGAMWWEPMEGRVHDDGRPLAAVVHLAGEGVADKRWTPAHKQAIRQSRVVGTRTLVDWLCERVQRPSVLVSASAVGVYGTGRGDEVLTEDAPAGPGFLAEVCTAWEAEAMRAQTAGIRVVCLRVGLVLSPTGGALERMLPVFRAGLGGRLGSGRQWTPWVHLDDIVGLIRFAIQDQRVAGPLNAGSPNPVRNQAFTKALGKALRRPTFLPAPAAALKLALPGLAQEGLLASNRMVPTKAQALGYRFAHTELDAALSAIFADP